MSVVTLQILIIIGIMIIAGIIIGTIAGLIWKDNRPLGVKGDYAIAVLSSIVFGIAEWFLIPALGFNQTMKLLGTFVEAPIISLGILWLIRYIYKNKP
jgi:hypothetical protein